MYKSVVFSIHAIFIYVQECSIFHSRSIHLCTRMWYIPCMRYSFMYKSVVFSMHEAFICVQECGILHTRGIHLCTRVWYFPYTRYSFMYKSGVFSIHEVFICVQECGIFHTCGIHLCTRVWYFLICQLQNNIEKSVTSIFCKLNVDHSDVIYFLYKYYLYLNLDIEVKYLGVLVQMKLNCYLHHSSEDTIRWFNDH